MFNISLDGQNWAEYIQSHNLGMKLYVMNGQTKEMSKTYSGKQTI